MLKINGGIGGQVETESRTIEPSAKICKNKKSRLPVEIKSLIEGSKTHATNSSYDKSVSQKEASVNTNYATSSKNNTDKVKMSLVVDSEGNNLTEAQAEFFKDSKVRDAEGNLLVVYHGTSNIGFTEFKGRNAYYILI